MRKVLIFMIFLCFSCESSLDLEPKMFISADEAFSNRENVYAALTGCYDALQLQHYYGRNLVIVADLASDNSRASGTKIEYYSADDNSLLADNILVEGIWGDIYTAINRVNYILYMLEKIDFLSIEEKDDIQGQLCFLRALHYFNLVRLYGDLPLKTLPTLDAEESNYLPRSPVEEVYSLIISDLEIAIEQILNIEPEKATQAAARALLSRVYLTIGHYSEAYDISKEQFESHPFLEKDYAEIFGTSSEPSEEILFYVPFSANDKNRLAEYHLPNQLGGRYENSPDSKLVNLLDANDQRKEWVAALYHDRYYTNKYYNLSTGSDKVIVLRNAELLFTMIEAAYMLDSLAYQDDILSALNLIHTRAGLDSIFEISAGDLWKIIDQEQQIEFAFEGKRWFDLIRTGRALSEIQSVTSENQMLFPIPLSEILSNPKIGVEDQNEGY